MRFFILGILTLSCSIAVSAETPVSTTNRDEAKVTPDGWDDEQASDSNECPEVSFKDIYESPDDIELNYCYLQQKIEEGDIKAAIPIVERILLLQPHQPRARIIYASLLYHSDMMKDARREFEGVKNQPLPKSDEMLVLDYLKRIDDMNKRASQVISVTVTGHHDNNINNIPDDDTLLFYGYEFDFPQDKLEEYGTETSISYHLDYSFGEYLQHSALASLEYVKDNYATQDEFDFGAWQAALGARFDLNGINLTAMSYGTYQSLAGDGLLRSHGGRLSVSYASDLKEEDIYINTSVSAGAFNDNYVSPGSSDSSGKRYQARITGSVTYAQSHNIYASLGYATKEARTEPISYTSWTSSLSYRWTSLSGHSIATYVNRGRTRYSGSSEFITGDSGIIRRDKPVFASVSYSMPIQMVSDFSITLTGEKQINHSDTPNYEYQNTRWSASLTKLFSF